MEQKLKQLTAYIDHLNRGSKPKEHNGKKYDTEYEGLMETVRRVRLLHEIEYPGEDFPLQLAAAVQDKIHEINMGKENGVWRRETPLIRRIFYFATVAAAAVALVWLVPKLLLPTENIGIVYAMEKAFEETEAYHGIITVVESNELGDTMTQADREVWADNEGNYYVKELEGTAKDIITVNNGEQKWQLRPIEKTSYLFATFPDPYRFTFELGQEIEDVKSAQTVKEVGEELVAGRTTIILQVTPDGGKAYRLWVDKDTKLPLQRESAMQNAIQYLVTYTSIEFLSEIPDELLQYRLPSGFTEIDTAGEQVVNTLEEAESMIGFSPSVIGQLPVEFTLSKITVLKDSNAIRNYYSSEDLVNTVVVEQRKEAKELVADSRAILGKINGNTAELLVNSDVNSIRWQDNGREYSVIGNLSFDDLKPFLKELTEGAIELPTGMGSEVDDGNDKDGVNGSGSEWKEPEIKVENDLAIEENEQKSVDAGHSPWKLDPVFVAQVFASLLLSPEGITGDYPIAYEDIKIIMNDGSKAIAMIESDKSIAEYIYMERLVRRDETGIWTVIGYDKADFE
jgi:outer membrane lipoprotein-sorting protein